MCRVYALFDHWRFSGGSRFPLGVLTFLSRHDSRDAYFKRAHPRTTNTLGMQCVLACCLPCSSFSFPFHDRDRPCTNIENTVFDDSKTIVRAAGTAQTVFLRVLLLTVVRTI